MRLSPANGHRDVAIAPGARSRPCLYSQRTEHPACLLESRVTFLAHMLDGKQQTAVACFMSRAPFLRTRPFLTALQLLDFVEGQAPLRIAVLEQK